MDNADPQNFSSKLSPDVEPFVPRQYQFTAASSSQESCNSLIYSSQSVQDIPPYITNCYPFVQEEYIGYDYNIPSPWVNNYLPNMTIQPHYTSMQIPLSPVYQPFQYSPPCYPYISKSKPTPPLRNKQHFSTEQQHKRRNYSNTSSEPATSQKSELAIGVGNNNINNNNNSNDVKQNRFKDRYPASNRSEHQLNSNKPMQGKKSNKAAKDKQQESFTQDIKKSPNSQPPTQEDNGLSNDQSGGKGRHSGTIQLQSGSRYHNRTLGDFILNVKMPKKGKPSNNNTQMKTETSVSKKKPLTSKPSKKMLQGTLPNGFEIRNSDWPTAGEMKSNQNKDQHRSCLFGSDIVSSKPKSFADIIKSSPSKNSNLSLTQTRNLLQFSWSIDASQCDTNREFCHSDDDSRAKLLTFIHTNKKASESSENSSKHPFDHSISEVDHSKTFINQALPPFGHMNIIPSLNNIESNCEDSNKLNNLSNKAQTEVPFNPHFTAPANERTGVSHLSFPRNFWKLPKKIENNTNGSNVQSKKEMNKNIENVLQKSNSVNSAQKNTSSSNSSNEKSCLAASNSCDTDQKVNFSRTPRRPKSVKTPNSQNCYSAHAQKECTKHGKENPASATTTKTVNCDTNPSPAAKISLSIQKTFSKKNSYSDRTPKCIEEKTINCNNSTSESHLNNHQRETGKRKKKRKSATEKAQLKKTQLAAMQGKMVFLTPDMYSKLISTNANVAECKQKENLAPKTCGDDYPVLGSSTISKKPIPTKASDSDRNVNDEDPEWSDIDSDYESSVGAFPVGNGNEQSKNVQQKCTNHNSKCSNPQTASGLSYSAALMGQSTTFDCTHSSNSEQVNQIEVNFEMHSKKLRKKKSPAKTAVDSENKQRKNKLVKPKPNEPIQLDISQMLTFSEVKKKVKKQKFMYSLNGKGPGKDVKSGRGFPIIANILDSTAPTRRRGKERETPAKKQPSALKKIILKEREERRHLRLLEEEKRKRLLSGSSLSDNDGNTSQDSAWETQGSASSATPSIVDGEEEKETGSLPILAKSLIHSRRFREYCNHMLKPEIDYAVTQLLQDLIRFHNRLYHKDPLKAKARRRIVLGLREVTKHLKLKKLKCLILAPNLDRIKSKGGLDDAIENILALAREQNIPYIFALGRKPLGKVCYKQVPVSCVGIFNYAGSEKNFRRLMDLVDEAQKEYLKILHGMEKDLEPVQPASMEAVSLVPTTSSENYTQSSIPSSSSSSSSLKAVSAVND